MRHLHDWRLDSRESLYLDLIRALAAFVVVLDHATTVFDLPGLPRWGHQAVIVFFVLSGYVISYVAATREQTGRAFVVARLARLWSVLLPAMILTIVCDVIGRTWGIHSESYASVPADHPVIRVGAMLVFLSETWVSIQPLSNGATWTLCAEFWYYMLFAAWVFLPPGQARRSALVLAAILSGFKALLLLPVWATGVVLQRWHVLRRLPAKALLLIFLGSCLPIAYTLATQAYDLPIHWCEQTVSPWVFIQLAQARVFWVDWAFGLVVAANLFSARGITRVLPLERCAPVIRWAAGVSFAAYLFHMPLLHLCSAFLPRSDGTLAIVLTCAAIAVLGTPVERTKRWWQDRIDGLIGYMLRYAQIGRT